MRFGVEKEERISVPVDLLAALCRELEVCAAAFEGRVYSDPELAARARRVLGLVVEEERRIRSVPRVPRSGVCGVLRRRWERVTGRRS